ncbi:MAG: ATP-binding protein [Verrucomicrobiae bacterium]|nr:ATP-binding protein [Verrucomicrobiae bacterium]
MGRDGLVTKVVATPAATPGTGQKSHHSSLEYPHIYVNLWIVIPRLLKKKLLAALDGSESRKVVCLFGPRQVGKTTLLRTLFAELPGNREFLNGDYADDRALLVPERAALQRLAGHLDLLFIDEAQNVPEIGRVLKLLHDEFPRLRVVASGSASFDLRRKTGEPLTGRQVVFHLFPFALAELKPGATTVRQWIEHGMIYGCYPEVVLTVSPEKKRAALRQLAADHLLKDLFAQVNVNRDRLHDLLRLIALQVGSEVSLHELAGAVRLDVKTVDRYLGLLEDAFVIFRLGGFSRNLRKEVGKSRKIYFTDPGIRNALLDAFHPPTLRDDLGRLWENYLLIERRKRLAHEGISVTHWFWRTYDQQEIDLIEETTDGARLAAFEFKWNPAAGRTRLPKAFLDTYPHAEAMVVTPENVQDFLL